MKKQALAILCTLALLSCTSPVEQAAPTARKAVTGNENKPALIRTESRKPKDIVDAATSGKNLEITMVYGTAVNFTGTVVPGYQAHRCYLQKNAAQALAKAASQAEPLGYRLHVLDCYRPHRASNYFMQWLDKPEAQESKASYYPKLSKTELRDHYIAEYSSHSRASTIAVTLLRKDTTGQWSYVNMGSSFDFFDPLSHMNSTAISKEEKANRLLLKDLMQEQGFTSYEQQWWHFTLQNEAYPNTYFDFVVN